MGCREGNAIALSPLDQRAVMLAVDHDPVAHLLLGALDLRLAGVEDRTSRARDERRARERPQADDRQ